MGLDADVRCRCWEDGLTSEPPAPVEVVEGGILWPQRHEDLDEVLRWKDTACAHEHMEVAAERIGTWSSVGLFDRLLTELGADRFPVLRAEVIGRGNEGHTTPARAAAALAELALLDRSEPVVPAIRIIDEVNGRISRTLLLDEGNDFGDDDLRLRFDYGGMLVGQRIGADADNAEVFRSNRWRVRLGHPSAAGRAPSWVLTDVVSGAQAQTGFWDLQPLRDWPGDGQDPVVSSRFEMLPVGIRCHSVAALRTVFEAAIATGNPVHWC